MSRFQPRQVDRIVVEELISIIKKSNDSITPYIRDFLHYHSQEKTVQNKFAQAFKTAYGVVKSFSGSQ